MLFFGCRHSIPSQPDSAAQNKQPVAMRTVVSSSSVPSSSLSSSSPASSSNACCAVDRSNLSRGAAASCHLGSATQQRDARPPSHPSRHARRMRLLQNGSSAALRVPSASYMHWPARIEGCRRFVTRFARRPARVSARHAVVCNQCALSARQLGQNGMHQAKKHQMSS